jgi:hypothetical protein
MRVIALVLPLVLVTAPALPGQVGGDSVRFRVQPSSIWNHGRFVSLEADRLTISQADSNQYYPLQTVTRLEVRRRKNKVATVVGTTLGVVAGVGLASLVRPANRRPLFGSDGANLAVAAGVGFVGGLISVSVNPWFWKRVRLKAAT